MNGSLSAGQREDKAWRTPTVETDTANPHCPQYEAEAKSVKCFLFSWQKLCLKAANIKTCQVSKKLQSKKINKIAELPQDFTPHSSFLVITPTSVWRLLWKTYSRFFADWRGGESALPEATLCSTVSDNQLFDSGGKRQALWRTPHARSLWDVSTTDLFTFLSHTHHLHVFPHAASSWWNWRDRPTAWKWPWVGPDTLSWWFSILLLLFYTDSGCNSGLSIISLSFYNYDRRWG